MKGAHIAEEEPAFPAVFASYIGFSWLGSCMVSRETCFFHLLRHASPLWWPACFHLSQLSSDVLLKVLSVFWETTAHLRCLSYKSLPGPEDLTQASAKKFPCIPVPVCISGCCLSVGCSAWAAGCTVNCSRTDGFGLSSWGRKGPAAPSCICADGAGFLACTDTVRPWQPLSLHCCLLVC